MAACIIGSLGVGAAPSATATEAPAPAPGTVTTTRPYDHALPLNATARIISYVTTLQDGSPVEATATVFEPTAAWRAGGPRPTIVFPPGTRGQGDQCAPSHSVLGIGAIGPGETVNVNYEYQLHQAAAAYGIRVVVPDLIGLGTPGHHSYVNHIEEAHAVLDAARATVPAGDPVGFAGYSQGGGAAAAAAEYAGIYAPELNVRGTYAGAVPADLPQVMAAVDGGAIVHVLGYAINGFAERDAAFRDAIYAHLNPRGLEFLRSAESSCILDSAARWQGTRTSTLTTTGESFSQLAARVPAIGDRLHEQNLGRHKPNAPMLVANSRFDDVTPYEQTRAMAGAFCSMGATIEFQAVPGTALAPRSALPHSHPFLSGVPLGLKYLVDRFEGRPAPSNCAL